MSFDTPRVSLRSSDGSVITFSIERVTQEQAAHLMAGNANNRRIVRHNLEKISRAMLRGDFSLTHQGIAISDKGRVLDGQHRLQAIIDTGVECECLITRGWPDSIFADLDQGTARTDAHKFGQLGVAHSTIVAAGVRRMLQDSYSEGDMSVPMPMSTRPQFKELLEMYYEQNADGMLDQCSVWSHSGDLPKMITPGMCFWLLAKVYDLYGIEIAEILHQDSNNRQLDDDHPLMVARELILRKKRDPKTRPVTHELVAIYIKAVNLWLRGKERCTSAQLRWRSVGSHREPYPRITTTR